MSGWSAADGRVPPFTNALAEHLVTQSWSSDSCQAPQEVVSRKHRRGPKVKTTPASSPLIERNRAHRQRKETYIKELEREVSRLRQLCISITRERDALAAQNAQQPAYFDANVPQFTLNASTPNPGGGGGYGSSTASSTRSSRKPSQPSTSFTSFDSTSTECSQNMEFSTHQAALDYDAIGIDFVSTLEYPCRAHMPYLVDRAHNVADPIVQHPDDVPDDDTNLEISGHALMAFCPSPQQDLTQPSKQIHSLPPLPTPSLAQLYGLSDQIFDLSNGELPPIKAWAAIKQDPRFLHFQMHHFKQLKDKLYGHVHCLRFGATIPVEMLDNALRNLDFT